MDPFVPEEEERLAHQETAAAKARSRNSEQPPPSESGLWPQALRDNARLIIPLAVVLALMLIQYGIQHNSISKLETQLASLQTIKSPQVATAPSTSPGELTDLQQELKEQAELIQTLEKRIATQIIDIDSLRGSITGNTVPATGTVGGLTSFDLEPIRNNLSKLEEALKSQQAAQQKLVSDVEQKLVGIDAAIASEIASSRSALDKSLVQLETRVAGLDSKIDVVKTEQLAAIGNQAKTLQTQLASQFDSRLDAVSKQAAAVTTLEQKITRQLADTDKSLAETRQQLSALEKTVNLTASANGDSGKTLAETRKALTEIEGKLDSMTTEMDAALARLHRQEATIEEHQKTFASNGANPFAEQIASQIDAKVQPQASLIKSLEAKLAAQVADIDGLRSTSTQLANEISATRTALDQARKELDSQQQNRLDPQQLDTFMTAVKLEITGLNRDIEGAVNKISQQENQLAKWRGEIESRIASSATPGTSAGSEDLDKVQAQLASQLQAMDTLRSSNTKLVADIASTRDQLAELRKTINTGATAAATAPDGAARAELLSVQTRVDDLTRKLEGSTARLNTQEKIFREWQQELEARVAASEKAVASSSGAAEGGIDPLELRYIKVTLAALKKQHPFVKFPTE